MCASNVDLPKLCSSHRVVMAVDGDSRLSDIPELQELETSWEASEAYEPICHLHIVVALFGLRALGLALRELAKRYYAGVKLPKGQKLEE